MLMNNISSLSALAESAPHVATPVLQRTDPLYFVHATSSTGVLNPTKNDDCVTFNFKIDKADCTESTVDEEMVDIAWNSKPARTFGYTGVSDVNHEDCDFLRYNSASFTGSHLPVLTDSTALPSELMLINNISSLFAPTESAPHAAVSQRIDPSHSIYATTGSSFGFLSPTKNEDRVPFEFKIVEVDCTANSVDEEMDNTTGHSKPACTFDFTGVSNDDHEDCEFIQYKEEVQRVEMCSDVPIDYEYANVDEKCEDKIEVSNQEPSSSIDDDSSFSRKANESDIATNDGNTDATILPPNVDERREEVLEVSNQEPSSSICNNLSFSHEAIESDIATDDENTIASFKQSSTVLSIDDEQSGYTDNRLVTHVVTANSYDDESLDYVPKGLKDYVQSANAELEQAQNDFKNFDRSIANTDAKDTNSDATDSKFGEETDTERLQRSKRIDDGYNTVSFTECRRSKRLHRKGMDCDRDDTNTKMSMTIKKRITANAVEEPPSKVFRPNDLDQNWIWKLRKIYKTICGSRIKYV